MFWAVARLATTARAQACASLGASDIGAVEALEEAIDVDSRRDRGTLLRRSSCGPR